jgi:hypothetical protein
MQVLYLELFLSTCRRCMNTAVNNPASCEMKAFALLSLISSHSLPKQHTATLAYWSDTVHLPTRKLSINNVHSF